MPTLPNNPTPEQYQTYFEQLEPAQQILFRKAGILQLINTIYTDRAEDLIEDGTPADGAFVSGIFIDKSSNGDNRRFIFQLEKNGDNFNLIYQPEDREKLQQQIDANK